MSAPPEESGDDPGPANTGGTPVPPVDAPMRAAIVAVFFCGLCLALVAFAVFGLRTGLSALLGGILATLNLFVFARVGQAFMERKGNTAPWAVVALLKLLLLFGGVWFVLKSDLVSALGLACGYAALPLGVTIASLFGPKLPDGDHPGGPHPTQSPRRGRDVIQGPRAGRDDSDPES